MSQFAVQFQNVTRWYGQVVALRDVTLNFQGGVVGLLGQNGAGKTTFLRILTGSMRPSKGVALVFGAHAFGNPDLYRRIGYCPDHDNFFEFMTGREFVETLLGIHGFAGPERARRASAALDRVKAAEFADRKIYGYSKGMRQRLKLAQALSHDPELLILDEPLNGADPIIRRDVIDLVKALGREGRSVIISSHVLHEVEAMTPHLLLLHKGRVMAAGEVREIRGMIDRHPHSVRLRTPRGRDLAAVLARDPRVTELHIGEGVVTVRTPQPDAFYAALPQVLLDAGLPVHEIESPDDNLDAVFRYLTEG
ncbi:MAG: ABC transporter ATP-binding protein [Candidatus Brocadiae bacterium]|nr:ABC transporter ATP-binding protein [Candidatus Brocadiia bacterium]